MAPSALDAGGDARIVDIRGKEIDFSILKDIRRQLRPVSGHEKRLPTMLLYDEAGLKRFEDITFLDEYYLTNAEIEVLERYADRIAEKIQPGSQVIELGSGNLRKVNILLKALDQAHKEVDYYALDLSLSELERTLAAIPPGAYKHVRCHGLHGTYDDGLEWLERPENQKRPKCIMTLGSSIGNFNRAEAADFLRSFARALGPNDILMVGVDGCQDKDRVYHAYNDRHGLTHEFVRNGLAHANRLLGEDVFDPNQWKVIGEYDVAAGRHQAFVSPVKDVEVDGVLIVAGERVRIEESYKYSPTQRMQLWERAGLALDSSYNDSTGKYRELTSYTPAASSSSVSFMLEIQPMYKGIDNPKDDTVAVSADTDFELIYHFFNTGYLADG